MVTMAHSAANWRNTHTQVDGMHSLAEWHQHSYNRVVRKSKLSYYIIWNQIFIFAVPEGGGSKPEYPEKTPDSLPVSHIRGVNPASRTGIEPSPSDIGDKLTWPRASHVWPTELQLLCVLIHLHRTSWVQLHLYFSLQGDNSLNFCWTSIKLHDFVNHCGIRVFSCKQWFVLFEK